MPDAQPILSAILEGREGRGERQGILVGGDNRSEEPNVRMRMEWVAESEDEIVPKWGGGRGGIPATNQDIEC